MRISIDGLRRYTDLPADLRAVRELMEDVGLEVKRQVVTDEFGPCFTLELLANRGDHHCYAGVACEIAGRTGATIALPPFVELTVGISPLPLRNEVGDLLLGYTATLLERTGAEEPLDARELAPLLAAEMDSVTPAVDATNLANLEFGQPTHAFDADTIDGGIVIRRSVAGERAWLLFTPEPRELPEGLMVIADNSKILAIAGVIGCEESKTTATTRRLLLESATFDPVAVRKAARSLNIHTDSSARFERGGDPALPVLGAGRVVFLLERHGWKRVGQTGQILNWTNPRRTIALEIGSLAGFLEQPLTEENIRDRLSRYGFEVSPPYPDFTGDPEWTLPPELAERGRERLRNTLLVRVPSWRLWDVQNVADLAEELAKSIGYNNTPARLPTVGMGALPSLAEVQKRRVEDVLVGNGFYEVFTDGFYGRDSRDRLGIVEGAPLWAHVETENAVDRGYSLLKNNAVAQAVDTVAVNLRLHAREIRAYEWTRTFHPDTEADNGVCFETKLLWAIACGPRRAGNWAEDPANADAAFIKGLVEQIGKEIGINLTVGAPDAQWSASALLHPNRQAAIRLDGQTVGVLGEIHPRILANYKIKRERPVYVEIRQNALTKAPVAKAFVPPPETQVVTRDLAFTLPHRFAAGDVVEQLCASGPSWLSGVTVTDLFEHEQDGKPVRTLTFTLTFARESQALTTEELNQANEALIRSVESKFSDAGVRLRA